MGAGRVAGLIGLGLLAAFSAAQLPEIKRYLKIRGM
jgi:hypothetical protein